VVHALSPGSLAYCSVVGRGGQGIRIHDFFRTPGLPAGLALLSGSIVGIGDDGLKTHATKPPNQGGERAERATKRVCAPQARRGDTRFLSRSARKGRKWGMLSFSRPSNAAISLRMPAQFRWTFFEAFVYNPATF
jgi:hypothetical protein